MTAMTKNQRCSKQTEVQYAQYARYFFANLQTELKPDLHPRHKNAGFEPCTFSLLSRQHSNPNDLHANPHTHNASCHHHLGSTWFKGVWQPGTVAFHVFHVHILKLRYRQRLREHTRQSAHRRWTPVTSSLLLSVQCTSLCFTVVSLSCHISYLSNIVSLFLSRLSFSFSFDLFHVAPCS